MIPKIIHYCWFGRNPLPQQVKDYIATWKKYCPDYEIKEWNEDNFDVNALRFTKEAYEKKKYAFVADVARLYALVHEGGIYLDTDVEFVKPLPTTFLENEAFLGFEQEKYIGTAIMACHPHCKFFEDFFCLYTKRNFVLDNDVLNTETNVEILTEFLTQKGLQINNIFQIVDGIVIFPQEYFSPKNPQKSSMKTNRTKKTICIHHFDGSWCNNTLKGKLRQLFQRFLSHLFYK